MRVDPEDLASYMGTNPIEIGYEVAIRFFADKEGRRAGLFQAHKTEFGEPCLGAVPFVIPGIVERNGSTPMWDVVKDEPLTLHPSISCSSCGKHGFIKNGKWEPA